jgi:hypothetical protein
MMLTKSGRGSKAKVKAPAQVSKSTPKNKYELAIATLVRNSEILSRSLVNRVLGKSFNGKRDLYDVLGYKTTPVFADYLAIYERDGLATRIVDAVSDETWREPPFLLDEGQESTDAEDSPSELQKAFSELADRLDLYASFADLDAMCGIGRFSLLFLGMSGDLKQPATSGGQLAYVTVYDEGQVEIKGEDLNKDSQNERFGLPERYWICMDESKPTNKTEVHWTRVIHVMEGRGRSRLYGVPRLKKIFNRLYDLEKVVGSSSEAFWLMIYRGMAFTAKEGAKLPAEGTDEDKAMRQAMDDYVNGLKRYIALDDMEANSLGGDAVTGKEQFEMICSYLAGSTNIPQRILLGSERGELASSQDDSNFADYIKSRQTHFAEPRVLRPFIERMGNFGLLPVPEKYVIEWPSLFTLNELEKADLAVKVAEALTTASNGAPDTIMPGKVFGKRYLNYVPQPGDGEPDPNLPELDNNEPLGDQNAQAVDENGNPIQPVQPGQPGQLAEKPGKPLFGKKPAKAGANGN